MVCTFVQLLCECLEFWYYLKYFSSGVGALSVMYEKGVLNSREGKKYFSRILYQVLYKYFEVFLEYFSSSVNHV